MCIKTNGFISLRINTYANLGGSCAHSSGRDLSVEGIVARANAQGVVPRDRERPQDECAENRLTHYERKNVALAREQPAHRRAADKREWNEHRIRPMKGGEEYPARDSRNIGIRESPQQAI